MNTIKLGSTGNDVSILQALLGQSMTIDGQFGPATDAAVRRFQEERHLGIDGIVGPLTWAELSRGWAHDGYYPIRRLAPFAGGGTYVLGAGGTDPTAPTPYTRHGSAVGSDCAGAVLWALGCPRHHPDFPEYQGDINTDSMLMDAGVFGDQGDGRCKFFRPLDQPAPGCVVVFRSIWGRDLGPEYPQGTMDRMGHVGLIVSVGTSPENHVTLECRYSTPAVRLGRNVSFLNREHFHGHINPLWAARYLEYVGPRNYGG